MSDAIFTLTAVQKQAIEQIELLALLHDVGKLTDGFIDNQLNGTPFAYGRMIDGSKAFDATSQANISSLPTGKLRGRLEALLSGSEDAPVDVRDLTAGLQVFSADYWDNTYHLAELLPLTTQFFAFKNLQPVFNRPMQPAQLVGFMHGKAHYEKQGGLKQTGLAFSASPFGAEAVLESLDDAFNALRLTEPREALVQGIADTRRPSNNISLWDWSFTVAALTRAAAARIFVNGWPQQLNNLSFRTLVVSVDQLSALTHSDKITDLLGVRQTLSDSYHKVRDLIEKQYGFGTRFYHDETGGYYLCPDFALDDNLVDEIRAFFPLDLAPTVTLGESVTAGSLDADKRGESAKLVAEPRQAAKERFRRGQDRYQPELAELWTSEQRGNVGICTVCRLRPIGSTETTVERWASAEKARARNICRVCLDRRGRRSADWLTSDLSTTIWLDEVADDSSRLALLVGKFDLDGWLNGKMVETIQVQSGNGQNPSPARLYRIAEEARAFWETTCSELIPQTVGDVSYRLALTPDEPLNLGHGHSYELSLETKHWTFDLNVVWDDKGGRFISAENLAYRWRQAPKAVRESAENDARFWYEVALEGASCTVHEPSQFMRQRLENAVVTIQQVELIDQPYTPQIDLMTTPSIGMSLIPATHALAVISVIKSAYEQQFSRVADRLPIHLNLVFFRSGQPLAAVLDAGRRFIERPTPSTVWEVAVSAHADRYTAIFSNAAQSFSHDYPRQMGDGITEDEWYPYLLDANGNQTTHIRNLDKQHVQMRPSTFDYEYLDVVGRRAEIDYDAGGTRHHRLMRPYLLAQFDTILANWQRFADGLERNQISQTSSAIEAKRERWFSADPATSRNDPAFIQFVSDTLYGANWKRGRATPELVAAGCDGQLTDLAELHLEIVGKAQS